MKRILAALAAPVVAVLLLAGCGATNLDSGSSGVDLSNADVVSALCGDNAQTTYEAVKAASEADPTSGKHNTLVTVWGLDKDTVSDEQQLDAVVATLKAKAQTDCSDVADDAKYGDVPDDIKALIGDPPGVDCVALATEFGLPTVGDKVMLTYITNEVDAGKTTARNTSDSVNIPALPATRDRVNASICTQPEQAAMVGVALVKHQPELVELNAALFEQFQGVTPKEWADKVLSQAISYEDATKTMTGLAGFMTIFDVKVENGLTTAWNYHAETVASTEANVRPIVENPNQYTGDFLVFRVTHKGETGCWVKPFGINVGVGGDVNKGDQRIAGFDCGAPPTTPSTPDTPTTPECTENCGGTPTCTVNCNPTPCVYDCAKDDADSVDEPDGVTQEGSGPLLPRPAAPATPAPVQPETHVPSSGSQAPGATTPAPRETTAPATGDTGTGSVNPSPSPSQTEAPRNTGDPGNPFGG